jgi:hypothetical protein
MRGISVQVSPQPKSSPGTPPSVSVISPEQR